MDVKIELKTVILECSDIPRLLSFYGQLLGWPVVFEEEGFVRIQSNQTGMGIAFQYDADYTPPVWPSRVSCQQMMAHLDFAVADRSALKGATDKAIGLGAKVADEQYGGDDWITMLDPDGHPFCFVIWD